MDSATAATASAAMCRTAVTSEQDGGTGSLGRGLDDKTRKKSQSQGIPALGLEVQMTRATCDKEDEQGRLRSQAAPSSRSDYPAALSC